MNGIDYLLLGGLVLLTLGVLVHLYKRKKRGVGGCGCGCKGCPSAGKCGERPPVNAGNEREEENEKTV